MITRRRAVSYKLAIVAKLMVIVSFLIPIPTRTLEISGKLGPNLACARMLEAK